MIDKRRVRKNFSGAGDYDYYTSYHNIALKNIAAAVKNLLSDKNHLKRLNILDAGCGTGQGYLALIDALPGIPFDYFGLDFAFEMLKKAKTKLNGAKIKKANFCLICADAEFLPFGGKKFDVIFSNMTLHWLENMDFFLNKCNFTLKDKGTVILSFLISGTLKEFEENFKNILSDSIKLHAFPDLAHIEEKICEAGLKIDRFEEMEYIETAKSSLELLKRINKLGAKNAVNEKQLSASSLRRRIADYDKYYRNDEQLVYCTYKIAFFALKKI